MIRRSFIRQGLAVGVSAYLSRKTLAQEIITARRRVPAGGGGFPTATVQLKSTTPTGGSGASVNTWNDSSGNANNATFSGTIPTIGTGASATPNSTQSVVMAGNQAGVLGSTLTNSSAMTVCAVLKPEAAAIANKQTLTSDVLGGGGFAYYYVTNGPGAQGVDDSFVAQIGLATETPSAVWQTVIVAWTQGGSLTFYRWDGTNSGVDTTSSFSSSQSTSAGIKQVFTNNGGTESVEAEIAELYILAGTAFSSAQASAYHTYAVSTYGVP